MKRWKFEYILTMTIALILALALLGAFMMKDRDLINVLIMPFVGALGMAVAFFFKQQGKGENDADSGTNKKQSD